MEYKIKRSNRKTISLELTPEGLLVRAPLRASLEEIEKVIHKHRRWIDSHMQKLEKELEEASSAGMLSQQDLRDLARQAREYLPGRVAFYEPLIGVRAGRITIRTQKSRWGSCSAKGNLNFNCLLMLTPPEVLDYVVVHELCHLKEMNHSRRFYDEVNRVYPEYDKWHRWLRDHGGAIMKRVEW